MRGIFIRDENGGEQQVFFGNAAQLLQEHGPTAKFLRYEDTGEPYKGPQPAEEAKAYAERHPEKAAVRDAEAKSLAKGQATPRGQFAVEAANDAMRVDADEEAPPPPGQAVEKVAPPAEPPKPVEKAPAKKD